MAIEHGIGRAQSDRLRRLGRFKSVCVGLGCDEASRQGDGKLSAAEQLERNTCSLASETSMGLRIIGDVHGQVDFVLKSSAKTYLELLEDCDYSIQLGDMGDAETYKELTSLVDPDRHRFFGGNHDHYPHLPAHAIGDFGMHELGGVEFFYVRGAASSDKKKLLERGAKLGRTLWHEEEELPESTHDAILNAYVHHRPQLVLTHTCPASISPFIHDHVRRKSRYPVQTRNDFSMTATLLQRLYAAHQPSMWCFGHYHHDWQYRDEATEFRCVGELSYLDVE